jgi:hypothetical protein
VGELSIDQNESTPLTMDGAVVIRFPQSLETVRFRYREFTAPYDVKLGDWRMTIASLARFIPNGEPAPGWSMSLRWDAQVEGERLCIWQENAKGGWVEDIASERTLGGDNIGTYDPEAQFVVARFVGAQEFRIPFAISGIEFPPKDR